MIDLVMVMVVLTTLALLGSSRLGACIRLIALQGVVLAILPLLVAVEGIHARTVVLVVGTLAIKGVVLPWLLLRALREADIQREVEPFVGFIPSMLLGVMGLAASSRLCSRLPLPAAAASTLFAPVAFFALFAGLLLIVSRRKAITQVIGYLVLENGIYTFGVGLVGHQSLPVELGVLLDVLAAVFLMGIAIFHIHREFDHIDADRLTMLRELPTRRSEA